MNYADSEKINMILMSAWLRKVIDPVKADIVIMNTCSVRQKWEDRVFGFMREISRYHKEHTTGFVPLFGITGCMVRKSGLAKRYLVDVEWNMKNEEYKRNGTRKIELIKDSDSLMNYDDELFLRSPLIDFVFRIEEVSYLTKILSLITGDDIGNDAKFNEYLQVKQLQENPASANIIIQTGCDNFCTFCIVPHTRGRELSRPQDDIVMEIDDVVNNWAKEVTLLGQNVNSYGKETKAKLWNPEELTWDRSLLLKGGADEERGGGGFPGLRTSFWKEAEDFQDLPIRKSNEERIHYREDLVQKATELRKNMTWPEKRLWYELLSWDRFEWFHFLRQKPLLNYIVDFYCDELAIVIEIDGESHIGNEEYDKKRDDELLKEWVLTIRYTNDEITKNLDGVRENLMKIVQERQEILSHYRDNSFQNYSTGSWNTGTTGNPQSLSWQLLPEGAPKTPFRELLEKISETPNLDRIRFTSSNPHDMTRDILDAHFDLPQMCPYLHFALQSGSDTMLRKMNRKHTYSDFKSQVDYLRSRDPLFSISTDIIVGFPWETEEEFQATANAMRECQFDFAFLARYSPRSGTIATDKYEDDISPSEKARRWNVLNDILRESVHARNALMIGREEEILISWEGKDETWTGRTRNWKEVLIDKWTMNNEQWTIQVWDLVKVKITESDGWVLKGERI